VDAQRSAVVDARRAALGGLIDYAGPFPPARLPIAAAAAEYERVRDSDDGWLMSRFAAPADALSDLARALRAPAPVTAILAADATGQVAHAAQQLDGPARARVRVEMVEARLPARAVSAADVRELCRAVATHLPGVEAIFLEIVDAGSSEMTLDVLAAWDGPPRVGAKLRFGGAAGVPSPAVAAAFLVGCAQRGLRAKGTAGLHLPLRGPDAHGFLNLLVAASLAHEGAAADAVESALGDDEPAAIALDGERLRWRERTFPATALSRMRAELLLGFGSCSIAEPADGLRLIGAIGS
jgi:hypothetical protein